LLRAARVVFLAAGDRPVLARAVCETLEGRPNEKDARETAIAALDQDLDPPGDLNASAEMRLHLAKILLRRVLEGIGA
jgi:carbon-monoxide dehydrogenase medium subunit